MIRQAIDALATLAFLLLSVGVAAGGLGLLWFAWNWKRFEALVLQAGEAERRKAELREAWRRPYCEPAPPAAGREA